MYQTAFSLAPAAEITTEVNPGTVSEEKLRTFRKAGINRLSIGMQSAQDEELRELGRIHDLPDFLKHMKQRCRQDIRISMWML